MLRPRAKRNWSSTNEMTMPTTSNGCSNWIESSPTHFDDSPQSFGQPNRRRSPDRKHDAMANIAARPNRCNDYLDACSWAKWISMTELLEMAERIISSLDSNGYLTHRFGRPAAGRCRRRMRKLAAEALEIVQSLEPRGRRGARSARVPAAATDARSCRIYDELKTLISGHLEDSARQSAAAIQRKDRLLDRADSEMPGTSCSKLNPKPGAALHGDVSSRPSRPMCFSNATKMARIRLCWKTTAYADPVHQQLLPPTACRIAATPKKNGVHQTQNQRRPVADRIDRTTPQHADQGRPGDRRSSERVPRRRSRSDRAAEDAADRRQGRRARDDRQSGGRRQVDSDAARHLSAEAVLRRRHARPTTARTSPGMRFASSCRK